MKNGFTLNELLQHSLRSDSVVSQGLSGSDGVFIPDTIFELIPFSLLSIQQSYSWEQRLRPTLQPVGRFIDFVFFGKGSMRNDSTRPPVSQSNETIPGAFREGKVCI